MGIGSRGAGGVLLGRGQQFAEFCGRVLPFGGRVGAEGIRDRAPAGVFHKEGFFGVGRRAALGVDALQRAYGFDIVESLIAQAAFADSQRVGYSEIPGWKEVWLGVGLPDNCRFRGGRFGRSSSGRNAHSRVASSQAAW